MAATLTVKETAKILNCNPETVRRMCRRNELQFVKLGNSPRAALRIAVDQPIIKKALGTQTVEDLQRAAAPEDMKAKADDFFA